MTKNFKIKEWFFAQYLTLALVLLTFMVLIYVVQNQAIKHGFAATVSFFYLLFGMYHHQKDGSLSISIVLEYLFISSLVLIVFWNLS